MPRSRRCSLNRRSINRLLNLPQLFGSLYILIDADPAPLAGDRSGHLLCRHRRLASGAHRIVHESNRTQARFRLVRTVGVVIIAVGLAIGVAAVQNQINSAILTLAITSAIGLTAIDVIYVLNKTIDKVYLLDAVAEVILIAGWVASIAVH